MSGDQAPDLINCLNHATAQGGAAHTNPSVPGRLQLSSAALHTSPPSQHAVLEPHLLFNTLTHKIKPPDAFGTMLSRSDGQPDTT